MDIRVGGQGKLGGPAMILAEGDKIRNHVQFRAHPVPPGDTHSKWGTRVDIAYISPGVRSQLGRTIWNDFPRLAQEGLYGGVLSTDWALLDLRKRRAKIRYRGVKMFDDKRLHELEYRPRNGVDYRIRLYFEPETFRHVAQPSARTSSGRIGLPRVRAAWTSEWDSRPGQSERPGHVFGGGGQA